MKDFFGARQAYQRCSGRWVYRAALLLICGVSADSIAAAENHGALVEAPAKVSQGEELDSQARETTGCAILNLILGLRGSGHSDLNTDLDAIVNELHWIRDIVLDNDSQGKDWVADYYRFGPQLVQRIQDDPQLASQAIGLLFELRTVISSRVYEGRGHLDAEMRGEIVGLLEELRWQDGSDADIFLAEVARLLTDPITNERIGFPIHPRADTFSPIITYGATVPAQPGAVAGLLVEGSYSSADLQVGMVKITWPAGLQFLGFPNSPQKVGTLTLDFGNGLVGSPGFYTDGNGRVFLDANENAAIDPGEAEVHVMKGTVEVPLPAGGDGDPSISQIFGGPRARLTLQLDDGLFRNPSTAIPTGVPIRYNMTAVSSTTGLAADGTMSVEAAVPATIADLVGRLLPSRFVIAPNSVPSLSVNLNNWGAQQSVDIFIGIQQPSGAIWTLNAAMSWVAGIESVVKGFSVGSGFELNGFPMPDADLFNESGSYNLYFAATLPGTFDFVSLTTTLLRVETPAR